ncbi:MAG: LacI family transcriptional regulator [Butyrivibrio sp.]|nr:LacI family transcriptional regulator [Butyrivibrio sp.]
MESNIGDNKSVDKMTIGDVAEALGVSKTTVSRAISGKGRIGNATRDKVLDFISRHNYTPSAIAKGLAQSKTYNIGWVIPGDYGITDLPFFQRCLMGIAEMASPLQYDILVSMVSENDISRLERAVTNHKVDGVILGRTLKNDLAAEYLLNQGMPFVAIGTVNDERVVQIDNDHRSACRELVSLLMMKGLRRIGLIGGSSTHTVTEQRLAGFMDAFDDAGLELDGDSIFLDAETGFWLDKAVEALMARGTECIVCMDDSICVNAINKLGRDGIKIPSDVKIASFFDSPRLEAGIPAVTALNFDTATLGREACRILMNLIDGREVSHRTLLGYDIAIKDSTK